MKITASFLLLLLILSMILVGCQQTTTEVTYKEISVGNMVLNIPTEWIRPDEAEPIIEDTVGAMGEGVAEYCDADAYQDPELDEMALVLLVMRMKNIVEEQGMVWEGWESLLESQHITKEDYLSACIAGFITEGAEEITKTISRQHTIHGVESFEGHVTFKMEGEPGIAYLLVVFAENDLGILLLLGEKSICEKYEDTWNEIRDSVQF